MSVMLILAFVLLNASIGLGVGGSNPYPSAAVMSLKRGARWTMLGSMVLVGLAIVLRVNHVTPGLGWPWWLSVGVLFALFVAIARVTTLMVHHWM